MTIQEWHNVPRIAYEGVGTLVGEMDKMIKNDKLFKIQNQHNLENLRTTIDTNERNNIKDKEGLEQRFESRNKTLQQQIQKDRSDNDKKHKAANSQISKIQQRLADLFDGLKHQEHMQSKMKDRMAENEDDFFTYRKEKEEEFKEFKGFCETKFKSIDKDLDLDKITKQTEDEKAQNKYQPKNFVDFFKYCYRQPFRTIEEVDRNLKREFEGKFKVMEISSSQFNREISKQLNELEEFTK